MAGGSDIDGEGPEVSYKGPQSRLVDRRVKVTLILDCHF